jgi:hypothetical protein
MKGLWELYPSGKYVWTIEHVFPQGKNIPEEWVSMIGNGDKTKAEDIQAELVHTLGNLTITGYNPELSSMSFIKKRDRMDSGVYVGYRNGLNLNEDLVSADKWTRDQITARTEKLIDQALATFTFDNVMF